MHEDGRRWLRTEAARRDARRQGEKNLENLDLLRLARSRPVTSTGAADSIAPRIPPGQVCGCLVGCLFVWLVGWLVVCLFELSYFS